MSDLEYYPSSYCIKMPLPLKDFYFSSHLLFNPRFTMLSWEKAGAGGIVGHKVEYKDFGGNPKRKKQMLVELKRKTFRVWKGFLSCEKKERRAGSHHVRADLWSNATHALLPPANCSFRATCLPWKTLYEDELNIKSYFTWVKTAACTEGQDKVFHQELSPVLLTYICHGLRAHLRSSMAVQLTLYLVKLWRCDRDKISMMILETLCCYISYCKEIWKLISDSSTAKLFFAIKLFCCGILTSAAAVLCRQYDTCI